MEVGSDDEVDWNLWEIMEMGLAKSLVTGIFQQTHHILPFALSSNKTL